MNGEEVLLLGDYGEEVNYDPCVHRCSRDAGASTPDCRLSARGRACVLAAILTEQINKISCQIAVDSTLSLYPKTVASQGTPWWLRMALVQMPNMHAAQTKRGPSTLVDLAERGRDRVRAVPTSPQPLSS